jgi:hypothetical protein
VGVVFGGMISGPELAICSSFNMTNNSQRRGVEERGDMQFEIVLESKASAYNNSKVYLLSAR